MSKITSFTGEYAWLSNFYVEPIGVSNEHYYQAAKAACEEDYDRVFRSSTPGKAKKMGRSIAVRSDWESIKLDVMERTLIRKFVRNPELREKLLATGDAELIEGNHHHDLYWGVSASSGQGENHLGRLLMKVRSFLQDNPDVARVTYRPPYLDQDDIC